MDPQSRLHHVVCKIGKELDNSNLEVDLSGCPTVMNEFLDHMTRFPFLYNNRLSHLDLSKSKLRNSGSTRLVYILFEIPTLRTLDLSWNEISSDGSKPISELLASPKCSIRYLNLEVCLFSVIISLA